MNSTFLGVNRQTPVTVGKEAAAPRPDEPPAVRSFHRILTAILLVCTVGACTTVAQQPAQSIRDNSQASSEQLRSCLQAIYNSPASGSIPSHLPLDVGTATLRQMTDNSFVTDVEITALLDIHPRTQSCKQTFLGRTTQTTPSLVPIFASLMTKSENSLIGLIQRKKTWGEHVRHVKDLLPDYQSQFSAEFQRIQAGLNRDQRAELAQRQAASNAMAQFLQTEQMISAMNRPVMTNCSPFGQTVNCVTR